jgi:hypothetical protein
MADVTPLYQQRDLSPLRVWPPRPSARTAVVLDHRDGYRLVTRESPIDPFEFIAGRFRQVFRVWLVPLQVEHESYQLPSSQLARPFRVDFNLTVLVTDPLTVVAEHRTDAWDAVEPVLRLQFRRIGRTLRPEELAAVEEQLSDLLTGLEVPEAGLQILRAGVTANLEGADLKRARERIEDEHRRLLDEQNSLFRGELERQEDQHRQKLEEVRLAHRYALDREREEHHHELESRRRAIYKQVMVDDRVLPGLLLLKLGARPAGGDAKDVDEVIEALKQARVDDVRVPFEVLARYLQVTERWQLEEPVGELIRRLLDRFEPRAVAGDDPPSS